MDPSRRTITIRTREEQSWTLRAAVPEIFTNDTLTRGDQVIMKVDLQDAAAEIAKVCDQARSEPCRSTH